MKKILFVIGILIIFLGIGFVLLFRTPKPDNYVDIDRSDVSSSYKIMTGYGPEDIAIDRSQDLPRIIISWDDRWEKGEEPHGGFDYYEPRSNSRSAKRFHIQNYDISALGPHGIDVVNGSEGDFLYVISHEDRQAGKEHKILKFGIGRDTLTFRSTLISSVSEPSFSPNDLDANDEGEVFWSNPGSSFDDAVKTANGYVGHYVPSKSITKLITGLRYPNGVLELGDSLFVSTSVGNTMHLFLRSKNELQDLFSLAGGDNILLANGKLYVAHHPNMFRFVLYGAWPKTFTKSPSSVMSLGLDDLQAPQNIFFSDGTLLSGSSTAVELDGYLYVSQVFEDFIVKIPMKDLQ